MIIFMTILAIASALVDLFSPGHLRSIVSRSNSSATSGSRVLVQTLNAFGTEQQFYVNMLMANLGRSWFDLLSYNPPLCDCIARL